MNPEQRKVMEHVVVDPDAWYDHAIKEFGPEKAYQFLCAKVARWKPEFERESGKPGYKKRAIRQAEEDAEEAKLDKVKG